MGWGSIEEPELEEGEAACYYKDNDDDDDDDDDTSIDPDIALSYIGEKLENVLGHFQKDFEGGVSAENLGAKFGGYGSFLPMYQRSPPIWSQPKTPPRVQNHSTSRSPGNLPIEGAPQNFTATIDAPVSQTRGTSDSCSAHLLNNLKSSSVDGLVRQDSRLVAEKVSAKREPSFSKSVNPPDQRKLTVRIKVGADKVGQKNAAIYSGLGLSSPSSSTGNSPEESFGTPFGSQEIPSESPACILQFLTSLPVSGELLLSPLHELLLNLITSGKDSVDSKPAAAVKGWHDSSVSSADNPALMLRAEEVLKGKKSKSIGMGENFEQTKHENATVDNKGSVSRKSSGSEILESRRSMPHELNRKPLYDSVHDAGQSFKNAAGAPEAVKQQQQDIPVKKREINRDMVKDLVKGESLKSIPIQDAGKREHQETRSSSLEKIGKLRVKSSQKDAPFDLKEDGRGKGNRIPASLKADSDISEGKLDSKEAMDHLNQKCEPEVAVHEHDDSGIPSAKKSVSKKLSSEGKKKMKGSQTNGKTTSDSDDGGFKSGVPAAVKDKRSAQKNVNKVRDSYKDLLYTRVEQVDNQGDPSERPSGDKLKDSSREGIAGKRGVPDTCKERIGFKRFTDQVESEIYPKEPLNGDGPPTKGMVSGVELVPAPPVLIEENWVCCDRCQKWRLLPYGTKPEHLPDKWMCSMLNWLSGMNRCDISEDETTKALQALYHIPLPETQNNLQNNADARHLDLIHQNIGSHYMTHQGKKKLKSKETSQASNNSGPLMNSNLMKNPRQEVGKSRSLKDKNQPPPEANLIKKTNAKHLSKSYNGVEKHPNNQEENDIIKGDAKPKKKIKRERESDQYGQGSVKKIKTEGAVKMDNKHISECDGHLGRIGVSSGTGLPTKAALKDKQKQTDNRASDRPEVSIRKPRDSLQGSIGSDSIDVKTYDERGIFTKRRKLKDCPDGQDYMETMQSNGNLQDTKVLVKEDSGDSGFRTEMKLKVSGSQGRDFRKTERDDKLKRGGTETRILLLGNRTNIVGESVEKAQQIGKYKAKLPSRITMEDIEALKKDLGSEQVSTAATSSSSKVSDSRRRRANYLEVKGSPVESVSSSPMRTSNMNILSPTRMTSSGKDDPKFGDFSIARGSLYGDDIFESNQSGTAWKRRVSSASHPESFESPVLEFWENNTRGKGVDALSGSRNVHLGNIGADILERHSPCPTDMHAAACYSSKERVSKKHCDSMLHQKKSGIVSSRSNENDKSSFSFERTADKVSDLPSKGDILNRKISLREDSGIEQNPRTSCHEVVGDSNQPFSDESSFKAFRHDNNLSKRDSGKRLESGKRGDVRRQNQPKHRDSERSDVKFSALCSVDERANGSHNRVPDSEAETAKEIISTQVEARSGKSQVNSHHDGKQGIFPTGRKAAAESQKGSPLHVLPRDASAGGEGLKVLKSAGNSVHQNETHGSMSHPAFDHCVVQDLSGPSHTKKEASTQSASSALKEAEKLRDYADRLKDSGFGFECNEAYFQAAVMFLHGASLLESSNSESNKHGEMSQMQIYSSAAKICETCALEYENRQEMAAAALAYKCTEVAYMRVVSCKNASTSRVWHDLQASLQMIPPGESPSSSASDIDNLNNQVAVDKAALSKGNGSLAGNHINGPRNRPNFVRLLDFTKDVNCAIEASMKSQSAFAAAANMTLEQAQKKAIISSVKRAIDFSFHDVEELVRLVRHAIGAISRRGFGGS